MNDYYDLVLVEDGEGISDLAYTVSYTATIGDLVLIDSVIYEVMDVVEKVPAAVFDMMQKIGAALMVEKVYSLAWDAKKGSVI